MIVLREDLYVLYVFPLSELGIKGLLTKEGLCSDERQGLEIERNARDNNT
jgi:hypothetical protein